MEDTICKPEELKNLLSEKLEDALLEILRPAGRLELLKSKPALTAKEVQELYGIPEGSLRSMRTRGGGPDYFQPDKNGRVLYSHEGIQAYLHRCHTRG